MRAGPRRFFGRWGGERLIDRYFELARFWGDLDHVMRLPPRRLAVYHGHAERIIKLERGK